MVPVIGWAHAGDAENYEELPKSWQSRVPTDCADPKAFGVSLEGYSMEPKFSDGDILIVQPSAEFHSGCYVVARFLNDGVIFRRLEIRGARIILVPLNPQYLASEHTAEEFSWIYPVWARITKLWKK
jgi:SOS-response transcriptional repressor LexA